MKDNKQNHNVAKVCTIAMLATVTGVAVTNGMGHQALERMGIEAVATRKATMPAPIITGEKEGGVFVSDVTYTYKFEQHPLQLTAMPVVTSPTDEVTVTFDSTETDTGYEVTAIHVHYAQREGNKVYTIEDEFNVVFLKQEGEGTIDVPFTIAFEQAGRDYEGEPVVAPVIKVLSEAYRGVPGESEYKEYMIQVTSTHPREDGFETSIGTAKRISNDGGVQVYRVVIAESGRHTPPVITVTDSVGNEVTYQIAGEDIVIDTTGIEFEVTTDDELSFERYSNEDRTFKVMITDNNKRLHEVETTAGRFGEWTREGNKHVAELIVSEEGIFDDVVLTAYDDEGNVTTHRLDPFVIDKTAPVITAEVDEERYFAGKREIAVTVEDASFRAELVTASEGSFGEWVQEGDKHTATLTIAEAGIHNVTINARDAATNTAEPLVLDEFVVLQTAPELEVTSEDTLLNGKYSNRARTFNIEVIDEYFDKEAVELQGVEGTLSEWTQKGNAYTATLVIEDEGTFDNARLKVADKAGNETLHEFSTFVIDKTAPEVQIDLLTDLDNSPYNSGEVKYSVTVKDANIDESGIRLSTGTHNGWVQDGNAWTTEVTLEAEGSHELSVSAKDLANNETVVVADKVIIDTIAPKIEVTSSDILVNGKYINTAKTFDITIQDANLDTASLWVPEGATLGEWKQYSEAHHMVSITFEEEGTYIGQAISISDKAGNESTYILEDFIIDKTAPEVKIELLSELVNDKFTADVVEYELTVSDEHLNPKDIVVNMASDVDWTSEGNTHTARVRVDKEGRHNLTVTAKDLAGNETVEIHDEVIIDRQAPIVQVTSEDEVLNGLFSNQPRTFDVRITGEHVDIETLELPAGATLGEWTQEGNTHITTLTFEEPGAYLGVTFSIANKAGIKTVHRLDLFIIDTEAPTIEVDARLDVKNGQYINQAMEYDVHVTDDYLNPNDVIASVGEFGEWVREGNTFKTVLTVEEEGTHNIVLNARDMAGNEAEPYEVDQVVIDTTAPVFEVSSSDSLLNGIYSNKERTFDVEVFDLHFDEETFEVPEYVEVSEWEQEGTTHRVTLTVKDEGVYEGLTLSGADKAGNETTYTLDKFVIDQEAPEVDIKLVTDLRHGKFTNDKMVYELTVTDASINVDDIGVNIGELSDWASEGNTHRATVEVTNEGVHQLVVVAQDRAGNVTEAQAQEVIIDKTTPMIEVTSDDELTYGKYSNSDRVFNIAVTSQYIDKETIQVPEGTELSDWTTEGNTHYATLTFTDEGVYEGETIRIKNKAGNEASYTLEDFVIDLTPPEIEVTPLREFVNGKFTKEDMVYRVSITDEHFSPSDAKINVGEFGEWTQDGATWNTDVTITTQGTHTLTVDAKDMAGNEAERVTMSEFILDRTTPGIEVTSDDVLTNEIYSNSKRTFNITITDSHFDVRTFEVPEGAELSEWTREDNKHYATMTFANEGRYEGVSFSLANKAGNVATQVLDTFVIDKTAPVIKVDTLTEFKNGNFANGNVVHRVTITEDNLNPNDVTFNLGTHSGWVQDGNVWVTDVTVADEGNHNLIVTAVDKAHNRSEKSVDEFILDTTAPEVKITSNDRLTNGKYSNKARTFEVEVMDAHIDLTTVKIPTGATLSEWRSEGTTHRATMTFAGEGVYRSNKFSIADKAGNTTQHTLDEFIIDTTAPVINLRPLREVVNGRYTNQPMVYEVSVTDAHLMPEDITINKGTHTNWVQRGDTWTTRVTVEDEGVHQLVVNAQDLSGNKAETATSAEFVIDKTAPRISVTSNDKLTNGMYSNKARTFDIEVRDVNFDERSFQVPAGATLSKWTSRGDRHRATLTFANEGVYNNVQFSLADKAGNTARHTLNDFVIDMTAPTINMRPVHTFSNGRYINHAMAYDVSVTDAHLDPKDITFSTGTHSGWVQRGNTWTTRVTIAGDGIHQLAVNATDKAGNRATTARSQEFTIDTIAPTIRVSSNDRLTYSMFSNRARSFNIDVTDRNFDPRTFSTPRGATLSSWTRNGDTHRATMTFANPGTYQGVSFALADQAGNRADHTLDDFIIDMTPPGINITPMTGLVNGRYINQPMTYNVAVTDEHLDPTDVEMSVGTIGGWSQSGNTWVSRVTIAQEGTHQLTVNATDKADNQAVPVQAQEFVLDTTAPVVTLTSGDNVTNGRYFNGPRTFVVTVNDENFAPEGFSTTLGTVGNWTRAGNIWTTTIRVDTEGEHEFQVSATDLAGNVSPTIDSGNFVIDLTPPEVSFEYVTARQVFNNELQPTVRYSDDYLDESQTSITLTKPEDSPAKLEGEEGHRVVTNLLQDRETDGFYTLEASVTDLAGNNTTDQISFAVNRFGSLFVGNAFDLHGQFIQEVQQDLEIIEYSIAPIIDRELQVYMNGIRIDLSDAIAIEEARDGEKYKYTYTIDREVFEEGSYSLVLITTDDTGNTSDTRLLDLSFVVDQTPPTVSFSVEDGKLYNLPNMPVVAFIDDLHPIDVLEIYVNGVLEENLDVQGTAYTFEVYGGREEQNVRVVAVDRAGNETVEEVNFYVTTNFWMNFRASVWYIPSVVLSLLAVVGSLFLIIWKRNKAKDEARKAEGSTTRLNTDTVSDLEE